MGPLLHLQGGCRAATALMPDRVLFHAAKHRSVTGSSEAAQPITGTTPDAGTGGTGGGEVDQRPKPVISVAPRPMVHMMYSKMIPAISSANEPVLSGNGATPSIRDSIVGPTMRSSPSAVATSALWPRQPN